MLSFLYVYSDHSILECYNLFSGVELSMRSFFVIYLGRERLKVEGTVFNFVANFWANWSSEKCNGTNWRNPF